jgi:hypothetical protein
MRVTFFISTFLLLVALGMSQTDPGAAKMASGISLPDGPKAQSTSREPGATGLLTMPGKFSPSKLPELPKELTASSIKPLQIPVFSTYGETFCDIDGNMYFHIAAGSYGQSPILRISSDGEESLMYKMPEGDESRPTFMSFNVSPMGTVRVLAESKDGTLVLEFDSEGKVSSRTKLDLPEQVTAQEFASFENGSVVFYGYYNKEAKENLRGQRYEAIFAPSGKLIKQIKDSEPLNLDAFSKSLPSGAVTLGKDGNLYLARNNDVLVISQSGEVVRRMPFDKNPSDAAVSKIIYSEGLLAIVLSKNDQKPFVTRRYIILDSLTGDERGFYASSKETSNIDVCFSRKEGFTFIHNDEGKQSLIFATLR